MQRMIKRNTQITEARSNKRHGGLIQCKQYSLKRIDYFQFPVAHVYLE